MDTDNAGRQGDKSRGPHFRVRSVGFVAPERGGGSVVVSRLSIPKFLGGYTPIIRRADLGAQGIYYRTMIGPLALADQATELCSKLKAAGVRCLVQKN
jgi:hypothetical protein